MDLERAQERRRTGEQPLLQQRHHEVGRLAGCRVGAQPPRPRDAIGDQVAMDLTLGVWMGHLQHHHPATGEPRRAVLVAEILLQPPDGHLPRRLPTRLDRASEPMRIKQLQQRRERIVITIVRGRRGSPRS